MSNDNFQSFIKNKDFISALEQFILTPNKEGFRKFDDAWSAQGKSNNPVLVNRVAAACTLEVSTTVDSGKFNQVFSWLIREGIIPAYPAEEDQDWFSKDIFLLKVIKDEFSDELQNNKTDEFHLSQFIWVLYENLPNPFSLKKQIVKYGAPGTGKTYQARQQTSLLFDIWKEEFAPNSTLTHGSRIELVQFHPSFSYEDFMEGLRPVLDGNGAAQLTLQNGVFKEFCRNARMRYCLKSHDSWPQNIICTDVAEYIRQEHEQNLGKDSFPLHKYLHHGLSSQAMVFNLEGPLIVRKDLEPLRVAVEKAGMPWPTGEVTAGFEYDDRAVFNEDSGQPTSIDLAISGDTTKIFIEAKLVEREFGGCSVFSGGDCDGRNPVSYRVDGCYLHHIGRNYWERMNEFCFGETAFTSGPICPFISYY